MELNESLEIANRHHKPYIDQLLLNLQAALPDAKINFENRYMNIFLYGEQSKDLKDWLHETLASLPEINHPIQRVSFIIRVDDMIELATVINPSEFDVMALTFAADSGLNFSSPANSHPFGIEAIPLDHPHYTENKRYFHEKYERVTKRK